MHCRQPELCNCKWPTCHAAPARIPHTTAIKFNVDDDVEWTHSKTAAAMTCRQRGRMTTNANPMASDHLTNTSARSVDRYRETPSHNSFIRLLHASLGQRWFKCLIILYWTYTSGLSFFSVVFRILAWMHFDCITEPMRCICTVNGCRSSWSDCFGQTTSLLSSACTEAALFAPNLAWCGRLWWDTRTLIFNQILSFDSVERNNYVPYYSLGRA